MGSAWEQDLAIFTNLVASSGCLIGVANINTVFVMLVGLAKGSVCSFFDDFNGFVVLTSHSDA